MLNTLPFSIRRKHFLYWLISITFRNIAFRKKHQDFLPQICCRCKQIFSYIHSSVDGSNSDSQFIVNNFSSAFIRSVVLHRTELGWCCTDVLCQQLSVCLFFQTIQLNFFKILLWLWRFISYKQLNFQFTCDFLIHFWIPEWKCQILQRTAKEHITNLKFQFVFADHINILLSVSSMWTN